MGADGSTIMHRIAQSGATPEIIKVVIAHGGTIWDRDNNGLIPLHRAAFAGRKGAVKSLLALDASQVGAVDKEGETPLHWAAIGGHAEVAQMLIEGGASVNAQNNKGMTPLHWACEKGNKEVAKIPVTNRADVDANGGFGETPLHRAVGSGNINIVEYLLNNNANPQEQDNRGLTPYQLAFKSGKKELISLFNRSNATSASTPSISSHSQPKPLAVGKTNPATKPALVRPHSKETALHKAVMKALADPESKKVRKGMPTAIAAAIKKRTLNELNSKGHSALMLACGASLHYREGKITQIEYDSLGRVIGKPYQFGVYMTSFKANLELAKELLAAGADESIANKNGVNALLLLVSRANMYRSTFWLNKKSYKDLTEAMHNMDIKYPTGTPKPQTTTDGTFYFLHEGNTMSGYAQLHLRYLANIENVKAILPEFHQ